MSDEPGVSVGTGAMDVIAGGGVGHLEAGIVDAVASLRGAGVTGFVVEGYDHYNGGTGYDDSHFVAEDPEGTAGQRIGRHRR